MDLIFDNNGNLKPYKITEVSMNTFRHIFVDSYSLESKRHELFLFYQEYLEGLSKILKRSFYQWVDGSFITTKYNPRDIDIITIIDYRDYKANKEILMKEFASFEGRRKYKVDAYIVVDYPENHKNYIFTKSDLLFWRNLFGKTRVNRANKQFEKGFIRLNFLHD